MHIPLLNCFAVSCAVCLQRALTVIKVCLLPPFLLKKKQRSLKSTLALKTLKSFIQLGEHKDFTWIWHLSVCTNLWCFSSDPNPVWWWLFLAYETWCFSKWHHFIVILMGSPCMIIFHDKFKIDNRYEQTKISLNFFCLCWGFTAQSTAKVISSQSITH